MFDFDKYRMVDLSPRMVARIKRLNGDVEPGNTDIFGLPWVLEEGVADYDNTLYTWIGGWPDDDVWKYRISGHFGSHTEGSKGHIDHWEGIGDIQGLWEYPLETFCGPAVVCNLSGLEPIEGEDADGKAVKRGQEIRPEHLDNVQENDIVLMCSPFRGSEQPYLASDTSQWLADKKSRCWRSNFRVSSGS